MERSEEYDSVITIDEFALDREWLNQPQLFMQFALELADAKHVFAERKARVDVVKAELELAIRQSPEAYKIAKVTEATILATILTQDAYSKAVRLMNKARHKVDVLQAVVDALDHRKRTLENLVTLHMANYFSKPTEKKKSKEGGSWAEESIKKKARAVGVKQREDT